MKNGRNMIGFKKKHNVKSSDRLFSAEIGDRACIYIYIIIRSRLKPTVLNGNLKIILVTEFRKHASPGIVFKRKMSTATY